MPTTSENAKTQLEHMSIAKAEAMGTDKVNDLLKISNSSSNDKDDEVKIINNTITSSDSLTNRYGIRQETVIKNSKEDPNIKARRILGDNCKPKEEIEVECIGDLDYRVGFGVHLYVPFLFNYNDCFMYIKSVEHEWKSNGMFISKLTLTPSRVMDEKEWTDIDEEEENTSAGSDLWERIYAVLKQQIGKPYVWGATGPDSFDCSGLVCYAYNQFADEIGFSLPRTTYEQVKKGLEVDASNIEEWEPGDLIFPHAGHVVVYTGNKKCIEAMQTGTNVMEHSYSRTSTYAVRRVIPEVSGGYTSDDFDGSVTNIPNALLNDIKKNVESMVASTMPNISNFKSTLIQVAKENSVDPYLLLGLVTCESNGNMNEGSTYYGLCQVSQDLANTYGYDRNTIEGNLQIGCHYYNDMFEQFDGNRPLALTAYNGGPGCSTIKALKGKKNADISLNDIYNNATNNESKEYAGRVLYATKIMRDKKALS